jgi:hypothetical protein
MRDTTRDCIIGRFSIVVQISADLAAFLVKRERQRRKKRSKHKQSAKNGNNTFHSLLTIKLTESIRKSHKVVVS